MVSYTIHFSLAIISFVIVKQTVSFDQISNFDSIIKNYNIQLIQKEIDILKSDPNEIKCSQDISTWFNSLKNKDRWAWESKLIYLIFLRFLFIYLQSIKQNL